MAKKVVTKKSNVKTQKCSKSRALIGAIVWFVLGAVVGGACFSYFSYRSLTGTAYECLDGAKPDKNGCCPGEVYQQVGDAGFNCCPTGGGDCFPPIVMN